MNIYTFHLAYSEHDPPVQIKREGARAEASSVCHEDERRDKNVSIEGNPLRGRKASPSGILHLDSTGRLALHPLRSRLQQIIYHRIRRSKVKEQNLL